MSMRQNMRGNIEPRKPIAIVRLDDLGQAVEMSRALLEGGITTLEFTLTNPSALEAIVQVRQELSGEILVGAGTVLDAKAAEASIQAGAAFLVTPALLPDVIAVGRERGVPVVCGAYTPTEILTAWRKGADLVKVFPAGGLGPTYIRDVLAPLPAIPLVPTGGINLDNCVAFLAAGAYTVAIGSSLVSKAIVQEKDWLSLTALARQYVETCTLIRIE
jgi:2-dehydro-3-deoxyphosphogluconate aldolase / (4S)-4-hydroxy-2-oxoglutarate aldolase